MELVSTSVGKLTVDLFNKLNEANKGKNIFFSPWSISSALALMYLGAKGNTAKEMAEVGCSMKHTSHMIPGSYNGLQNLALHRKNCHHNDKEPKQPRE